MNLHHLRATVAIGCTPRRQVLVALAWTALLLVPAVRLLSISFDGAHDTPAVLQAYARSLQADPALWHWVRVPDAAEQQALLQRLGVVVVPDGRGDYEHNAAFLVLDAQGRMVRVFDLAEQQLALDFARHLAKGGRL